ncbi:uncharacterized protein APUU_11596S [Aspergillus puulaauensis]|uniref:Uncharacterized protein n=1 Tax=Aspergillus puulaauensis TaxID=1220207 RepID=A0A7R7XCZ0_9EURO|nr:uncharacterized protein APUU_11596S [Aspergillus puulaauensis]BCS18768.1 hypothetical protein APUU_11596S [Aspergillus puulaauensis]
MKFSLSALVLSLTACSSAYVTIGSACKGSGYDCAESRSEVAVCNGRLWQVAADCGKHGVCIWPGGDPAPSCTTV